MGGEIISRYYLSLYLENNLLKVLYLLKQGMTFYCEYVDEMKENFAYFYKRDKVNSRKKPSFNFATLDQFCKQRLHTHKFCKKRFVVRGIQ